MVKKTLSIIIDSEIEDIVRSANHEGIIDCKKVIVRHCEPGIMYTLDCESGRIKAIKSTLNNINWVISKMK